ncbi:ATP-binding protein [Streptomyces sp. DSM 41982]|uniref:ATP-binding protein n=1 Tax=Streptomyces evansiae TaxID=3075535 RepID=A0ABD5ECA0_9ACTN|nr:ATP-binding protein [Streptomyces sp. DSM 41982]MDT0419029.1 ATP-binding protein [Streptomyces sp. DSM 41982]
MVQRPLPRILRDGGASLARGRDLARSAADGASDVLRPLIVLFRGLVRLLAAGRRRWTATPRERRGALLFLAAAAVLAVALAPYGPVSALVAVLAAAAWLGRDRARAPEESGPSEEQAARLASLYEALVPYFSVPEAPEPLYAHGGEWQRALSDFGFDERGRLAALTVAYPAYFADGDPESRARVERLLHAKCGRGREYHFAWDEEANRLTLTALPPLPTDIPAQPFVTSPGEVVLGLTDALAVRRTVPLVDAGGAALDVPPVVWRTGARSPEPHLLVAGRPGSGTSTLLRAIALQALRGGDVLVVDGGGTGDYTCFVGRDGVLGVECGLAGALGALEWAARETERRLVAANRARQAGEAPPEDVRRPLWVLVDRPAVLGHLARAEGLADPQSHLRVPLRHGRAAQVTVVVAEQYDCLDGLDPVVAQYAKARVALAPAGARQAAELLGAAPQSTPAGELPPGRGYARLGTGPVLRLQVPATPDPYDDSAADTHREAVLALLPRRGGSGLAKQAGPAGEEVPVETAGAEPDEEPTTQPVRVSVADA